MAQGDGNMAGGFSLGFEMRPLMEDGGLDTSLDSHGRLHSVEHDMLYKMAMENREGGNKMVASQQYEQAIGRYSEAIMQLRSLDGEQDVKWDDAGRLKVRELRAAAYLNLSLCFLKTEQWTHAVNTATRAIQGDKQVPDPADAVLQPDKKAKALFRRATAHCEGFGSFDKARDDLREAAQLAPDDKAIEQMLRKCDVAVKKTTKAADKKLAGFLQKEAKSGEGLFDDSLRPSEEPAAKPKAPSEPMKLSDGLFLMPQDEEKTEAAKQEELDLEQLGREITEMKVENPSLFAELQLQVKDFVTKNNLAEGEGQDGDGPQPAGEEAAGTAPAEETAGDAGAAAGSAGES